jgi:hypothetical protein
MTHRVWLAVAIVVVPFVLYVGITLADGAPRFPTRAECMRRAVEGRPVDLVYGRFDSPASADHLRDRVVSVGFTGTEVVGDGCGRWKVVLENIPSVVVASQVRAEAMKAGFAPALELGTDG